MMKIKLFFRRRGIVLMLLFLFIGITSYAQTISVTGTVTDEANDPMPGVNIVIDGTVQGTVTDLDGNYSIDAPANSTLIFNFIGFQSQRIQVNNRNYINVVMRSDFVDLDEIVVVGYGTQRRADMTSAIAILDPGEVTKMPGGLTAALQGTVAGVNVSGNTIRIRGTGSIGNTDPLIVVDGLIDGLMPNENEIESIQILKDAASTAIFGSRGANGVIIVTTKRGQAGPPRIEYNAYTGTKYPWRTLRMMNSVQFSEFVNEAYYNAGNHANTPLAYSNPYDPDIINTDWQDAWFRRGWYHNHNISISGGGENSSFRSGINYSEDVGTVIRNSSDNIGLFLNSQFTKGRVTVGQTMTFGKYSNRSGGGRYFDLLRSPNTAPIYDPEHPSGYYEVGNDLTGNDMVNQIAKHYLHDNENEYLNLRGTLWAEYEIVNNLKYKFNLGYDMGRNYGYTYIHEYELGKDVNAFPNLRETSSRNNRYLFEHTLSYETTIADRHRFSGVYGITSETTFFRSMRAEVQEFPSPNIRVLEAGMRGEAVAGREIEMAQYSHLGRIQYAYADRYLFTANFRMDESSKFPRENRRGFFPSVSAGWRLSEEAFIQDALPSVSNWRIRASYGSIGNQNIGGDYQFESFVVTANQFYTFGPDQANAFAPIPKVFGTPDLKWETSWQTDIGMDLGLFNNRLNFVFDVYDKRTKDMLVMVPIPRSSGSNQPSFVNAGEVMNRGLEITVNTNNRHGRFHYNAGLNLSFVQNEVLSLGTDNEPIEAGETELGYVTKTAVGHSIGRFYGFKTDGIFRSQEEIDAHSVVLEDGTVRLIQPNARVGDVRFLDLDGDGRITDEDKDFIGTAIPKVSGGFNLDLGYGNWDFSMLWQGDYGHNIYNNGVYLIGHGTSALNQVASLNDRFRAEDMTITTRDGVDIFLPANPESNIPRAVNGDPNRNFGRPSDLAIEDGSYLRLKRITLGYTLPQQIINPVGIESLRVYIGAKNLITFTNYSLFDPEVEGLQEGDGQNLTRGIDMQRDWASGNYTNREFFVGVQMRF